MARWHHQCNGPELGQTSEDGEGQRDLACCSPWGHKELEMTGQVLWLDYNDQTMIDFFFLPSYSEFCLPF